MCHPMFLLLHLMQGVLLQFLLHPWPLHLHPAHTQYQHHPQQHPGTNHLVLAIHVKLPITPKSAITTKYPPNEAYITAVEEAASKLPSMEADELKSDVSSLLRHHNQQHNNHSNLNPAQSRALTQLKQDTSKVVLTADKGVAMVIMDQQEYINNVNTLLQDTNTYKVLSKDPTTSLKSKLVTILRNIKNRGTPQQKYKQLHSTLPITKKICGDFDLL